MKTLFILLTPKKHSDSLGFEANRIPLTVAWYVQTLPGRRPKITIPEAKILHNSNFNKIMRTRGIALQSKPGQPGYRIQTLRHHQQRSTFHTDAIIVTWFHPRRPEASLCPEKHENKEKYYVSVVTGTITVLLFFLRDRQNTPPGPVSVSLTHSTSMHNPNVILFLLFFRIEKTISSFNCHQKSLRLFAGH